MARKGTAVIVVGDWVVDEYWYLASHISERSSHTGFAHYRVSSTKADMVSELCGAGRVARVIFYQLKNEKVRIHGLGNWNARDTNAIRHLVHARTPQNKSICKANLARYQLHYDTCDKEFAVELWPLHKNQPTIRVVRLYHEMGDGRTKQINRVDWESGLGDLKTGKKWKANLPPKNLVDHIVVHDLGKGAVTANVVGELSRRYKDAVWHVRSKVKDPNWFKIIERRVFLNLIGPEVASLLHPMESLFIKDSPPRQVMDTLESMGGKNRFMLSDNREVVGLLTHGAKKKDTKEYKLVTGKSALSPSEINELGWPSSFFGSLVAAAIESGRDISKKRVQLALQGADEYAGIPLPIRWPKQKVVRARKTVSVLTESWSERYGAWERSSRELGLVSDRLEVWRSFCPLPGYVSCIDRKQRILTEIAKELRQFKKAGPRATSLSIMLQADPGSGKTALARVLADAFDLKFMQVDITQMLYREELLDLFDEVTTRQAKESANLLVFVDEVNALLQGTQIFGSFLTPLEEGFYVRRGRTFKLYPCVWVFAGTRMVGKERDKLRRAEKLSDFESRISLQSSIDYRTLEKASGFTEEFYAQARLEQVYLGALMIKNHFPDVHTVSCEILKYFHGLNPASNPARRIRRLARSLRNVQYGSVTRNNCFSWEKEGWPKESKESSRPVRLVFGAS